MVLYYEVGEKDTPEQIASRFRVSLPILRAANPSMSMGGPKTGDRLVIPGASESRMRPPSMENSHSSPPASSPYSIRPQVPGVTPPIQSSAVDLQWVTPSLSTSWEGGLPSVPTPVPNPHGAFASSANPTAIPAAADDQKQCTSTGSTPWPESAAAVELAWEEASAPIHVKGRSLDWNTVQSPSTYVFGSPSAYSQPFPQESETSWDASYPDEDSPSR